MDLAVGRSAVIAAFGITVLVVPGWSEEGESVPAQVTAWLKQADDVARAGGGPGLVLDESDVPAIASALVRLHERHVAAALAPGVLKAEVERWGAVLGEIHRRSYPGARWGRAKKRNRGYGLSVYIGVTESGDFEFVQRLITVDPVSPTIEQQLRLYLLPPQWE